MKKLYAKVLLSLVCMTLFGMKMSAQTINWQLPSENPESTATVLIAPEGNDILLFGNPIEVGDTLGVFVEAEAGVFNCAGKVAWEGPDENLVIAARGDISGAGEPANGFVAGDDYIFYVKTQDTEQSFPGTPTYDTSDFFIDTWGADQFTKVTALVINADAPAGCMDETAINYNPLAFEDDGSCVYTLVLESGTVVQPVCTGDLGSVPYTISGGTEPYTVTVDGETVGNPALLEVGTHTVLLTDGGVDELAQTAQFDVTINEPEAFVATVSIVDNHLQALAGNSYTWSLDGVLIDGAVSQDYTPVASGDYTVTVFNAIDCSDESDIIAIVIGCMDDTFVEYNADANIDDGSCATVVVEGCTDDTFLEYNPDANTDDGSCLTPVVEGCTDDTAFNYNADANVDDGSCVAPLSIEYTITNPGCDLDNGTVDYTITGGTPPYVVVFGADEITSPILMAVGLQSVNVTDAGTDDAAQTTDFDIDVTGAVAQEAIITVVDNQLQAGEAVSYQWYLDGTLLVDQNGQSYTPFIEQIHSVEITDANGCTDFSEDFAVVFGCTDSAFLEYDELSNIDDGTCVTPVVEGCTDDGFLEYNPEANVDDGSCLTPVVFGCTDIDAVNYNELADADNGSCVYPLVLEPSILYPGCSATTGEITYTITGGTEPYIVTVDGEEVTSPFTLDVGEYTIVVNDSGVDELALTTSEDISVVGTGFPIFDVTSENGELIANIEDAPYQWHLAGVPIEGATEQTYTPTEDGSYAMLFFDENGCFGFSGFEVILGCTDPTYLEYNEFANVLSGCNTLIIEGCTDPDYVEFNPDANVDDGSCLTLPVQGCTDPDYLEYEELATVDDGSCETLVVLGCTNPAFLQYNPDANVDDGSCLNVAFPGCTDELYLEYDENANQDDGSCLTLVVEGCTDDDFIEYNPDANVDDGSCVELVVFGCTDEAYFEYDPDANVDDGSCIVLIVVGCVDEDAINFDEDANFADESCVYPLVLDVSLTYPGCNQTSGTIIYTVVGGTAPYTVTIDGVEQTSPFILPVGEYIIEATDSGVDELAQVTSTGINVVGAGALDVSLVPEGDQIVATEAALYDWYLNGELIVEDAPQNTYTPLENGIYYAVVSDDNGCEGTTNEFDVFLGCMDPDFIEYNPSANVDDGSCDLEVVYGCTDPDYVEYELLATVDDGSCDVLKVLGCMDPTAFNFSPIANTEDGTCIAICEDGIEVSITLNTGNAGDQTSWNLVGDFASVTTTHLSVVPTQMEANMTYTWNFCMAEFTNLTFNISHLSEDASYTIAVCDIPLAPEDTQMESFEFQAVCPTVGLGEIDAPLVQMYPNPAQTTVTVQLEQLGIEDYQLEFVNIVGQSLLNETFRSNDSQMKKEINVEDLPRGIYFIRLQYQDQQIIEKLILN